MVKVSDPQWFGEPKLGSILGKEEQDVLVQTFKESCNSDTGFFAQEHVESFEAALCDYTGATYAVTMNSAGAAIDTAVRCAGLEQGDEAISCAINFHGTHLAILGSGARLVLAEPDAPSLNIDPEDLHRKLTPKTRMVIVTHMNGHSARLREIEDILADYARLQGLAPILCLYDAARSLGATHHGKKLGGEGWATAFSFQSKKIITTLGEGGALVTNDVATAERAREIRSFGLNRAWGSNLRMSKMQAAIGVIQLRKADALVARRRELGHDRTRLLKGNPFLILPQQTTHSTSAYYTYDNVLDARFNQAARDEIMAILKEEYCVGTVIANPPTRFSNSFVADHVGDQPTPVSDRLGERLFCTSIHPAMTDQENERIAKATEFVVKRVGFNLGFK